MATAQPLLPPSLSLAGKRAVVTGANTGIGKVTALELARAGATVVLACRSRDKAEAAMADIRAEVPSADLRFHELDLGSLRATRASAAALAAGPTIDILINNAGLAGTRGATADGFELAFGTNHMGTFAFTMGLLDRIADGGRIVILASRAHYRARGIDFGKLFESTASVTGLEEYGVSKLANVLFAAELARRVEARGIVVSSLHPGVVASDIWRSIPWGFRGLAKLFMISNREGARTSLYCATSPELVGKSGRYWDCCREKRPSRTAQENALAAELWLRSEGWLKKFTDEA